VASDPEELLRSIERTREELANTVDTIAGRLDPKRAAKRGVAVVREGMTGAVEGARAKLHLAPDSAVPPNSAEPAGAVGSKLGATAATVTAKVGELKPLLKKVPKPAAGGLAALLALAAIMAVRRRRP
jgi:MYXO-CTERM domain-containing protein